MRWSVGGRGFRLSDGHSPGCLSKTHRIAFISEVFLVPNSFKEGDGMMKLYASHSMSAGIFT
jgi:hypothetical protein